MTSSPFLRPVTSVLLGAFSFALASCGATPGTDSPPAGSGGTTSTGGSAGSGGSTGTGGQAGPSTGGNLGAGGVPSGGTNSGGTSGAGGAPSGGGPSTGGSGSGGDVGTGGSNGTGGGGGFQPPTEPNSIAYTGCSMANNIGTGYGRVGGTIMWNANNYQTGAMVVQNWTSPSSSSWQLFDQKMNSIGGKDVVKAIMVQICILAERATDEELHDMVNAAREHVNPGTHIYIVGQPVYNDGHECFIAGEGGADWTDEKAQELANDPSINENMSYLGKFILDDTKGEVAASGDTCHATSPVGEDSLGEQAKTYWGG
jgi:hypothetical protein